MHGSIIIMGVSGSGKSTIGQLLASQIGFHFLDADDFHPVSNKQKMASGIPLNDADRLPWLKTLHQELQENPKLVLACSALKTSYREILDPNQQLLWVFLSGSEELILERMKKRQHFMKPEMLQSQLDTLEAPEDALEINIDLTPEEIVDQIIRHLNESTND